MKSIKIIFATSLFISIIACNNKTNTESKEVSDQREALLKQIHQVEGEMHQSLSLEKGKAVNAIETYKRYVKAFPTDSLTPDYLFKAAEIYTAMAQYPEALAFYKNITDNHPNYKLVEEALFLQASLLDNFMNDDAKAKTLYEQFISKYPNSHYINDVKAAVKNLGKPDEELIKEFEKKNGIK